MGFGSWLGGAIGQEKRCGEAEREYQDAYRPGAKRLMHLNNSDSNRSIEALLAVWASVTATVASDRQVVSRWRLFTYLQHGRDGQPGSERETQ